MKRMILSLVAALGLSLGFTTPSLAMTAACGDDGVTVTTTAAATTFAFDCNVGQDTGNTNDASDSGEPLLGILNNGLFAGLNDNWSFIGKSDQSGSGVSAPETSAGSWTISPGLTGIFAISLKVGSDFSVYAFNTGFLATGGDFNTQHAFLTNARGKGQDVSHVSVYEYVSPIPLPAAAWMLLAGLGGLGLFARRRAA